MAKDRELMEIALEEIGDPAEPIRRLADAEKLEDLRRSVEERGVLVPLIVVRREKGYEVVAGLRRVVAARAAGLESVPCVVIEAGAESEAWAMYVENRLREPVNPLDEAMWLCRMARDLKLSNRDLAARLSVSESWVSQRMRVVTWPEDVKSGLAEGWLSFAVARELAQIGAEQRRRQSLRMARVSGCTARQAADWRRRWQTEQGALTLDTGGGEYRQPPEAENVLELHCELCARVTSEAEQRVLMLCVGCKASVDALSADYAAKSCSKP